MAVGALSDLKVVEAASLVAGPWCGKHFSTLGAEVVKVEKPGEGDVSRRLGPFPGDIPHPEKSGLFLYLNTNKLGVTLDLAQATGRKLFLELVREADILIEDHPPALMEEWGLTYSKLREVNPRLIMTSITPFGQTGPYRDWKGDDLTLFMFGGIGYESPYNYVTQPEREYPVKGAERQTDMLAGWTAASATMVAVFQRKVTGEGMQVDISGQEAAANVLRPNFPRYSYWGEVKERLKPGMSWVQPCADGFISTSVTIESQWQALLELMGRPEWALSDLYKDRRARGDNWESLEAMLQTWLIEHPREWLFKNFQERGMICFPVRTADEVVACEQMNSRDYFVEVDHPVAGCFRYPGAPGRYSATPAIYQRAPLLGEHNEEIFGSRLGHRREELVRLAQAGVI